MSPDDFWGETLSNDDPTDRTYVGESPGVPRPLPDYDPGGSDWLDLREPQIVPTPIPEAQDPALAQKPARAVAGAGSSGAGFDYGDDFLSDAEDLTVEAELPSFEVPPVAATISAPQVTNAESSFSMQNSKAPVLDADIVVHRDGFTLDVRLAIGPGETVAVVGPNGCGKSTLVAAIAGFIGVTFGTIQLNGITVDAPQNKVWEPPERRSLALVPQEGLLLPHLSAIANVGYGLKYRGGEPTAAKEALKAVGLGKKRRVKPAKLSGGEAQRVALARAVVLHQPLLILDEPFSKVDTNIRPSLREWVNVERPPGQAQLVVTHGADHAREADLVVCLEEGSIAAVGQPAELAARPPTEFLHTFFS